MKYWDSWLILSSLLFFSSIFPVSCPAEVPYEELRRQLSDQYQYVKPLEWGEVVTGVKRRLATGDKVIALTFDACGSTSGMRLDTQLVEFLEKEQIPATLFINARWIDRNRHWFDRIAANPLFEVANHGYRHQPASVSGKSAYGIEGTKSVEELIDEIALNSRKIQQITGKKTRFFRSGTAFYDEVAVKIAGELGHEVAGYSVLGDAGASFSRHQVKRALLGANAGDIVILHMNHPGSGTAAGVIEAVPDLKRQGFRFVRLSDYQLE